MDTPIVNSILRDLHNVLDTNVSLKLIQHDKYNKAIILHQTWTALLCYSVYIYTCRADLLVLFQATQICVQQENHFSNLIKELEDKLGKAIAGRDELLTLR